MKKIWKRYVFVFVLGAIIFGSISVVSAYAILAGNIEYSPKDTTWEVDNVESALNDLYNMANTSLENIYSNPAAYSTRDTRIQLDSMIDSVIVECFDNNESYYIKLAKGNSQICGYHYLVNDVWYEKNRYIYFDSNGTIYIGWPRIINLSTGTISFPNDDVLYIKNIYK